MANRAGATDEAGVGTSVERREDRALLTGEAEYADDLTERGMVHMAVLRSRYAHADVSSVDTAAAEATDGVLAVYTAADVESSGVPGTIPLHSALPEPDGPDSPIRIARSVHHPGRPLLADEVVRYVGEPIAVVVAEGRYVAHDALDRVEVEYGRREAVTDPVEAVEGEAVAIHDARPDNVAFEWETGDADAAAAAFESAALTVDVEVGLQRVISNPIEPRAVLAEYAPSTGQLSVQRPGQGPHSQRRYLSEALGLPENRIRVRTPHVGGSFGTKSQPHPAEFLAAWAAMELGRPVKWQATRSETHVSSAHGRGHASRGELALDADGSILGLRVTTYGDVGGHVFGSTPGIHTRSFVSALSGQYAIPAIHARVIGAFTTTTPVSAYRGTGRPRAILLVERLVEKAARELDVDPVDLRRRNFIDPDEFPYRTPLGHVYDSGDYGASLARVLEALGYDQRREEQADLRDRGRHLGIGLSCSVDQIASPTDGARVRIGPDGEVTAYCGTYDTGQGHETTFAQLVADDLGVPYGDVEVREGDSEDLAVGGGTGGSRSAVNAGAVLARSADRIVEKARRIAAHALEAAPTDLAFDDGEFHVVGAPERSIRLKEVARLAHRADALPEGIEPGLEASASGAAPTTYSFATHAALVEVDPRTGEVDLRRFVAVEDCGVQINPRVVEGQIQGAVVQGIGQALYEGTVYDENGSLLTGSLQDYAMPKAVHVPDLEVDTTVTPGPETVRGVKGIGESGTNAAPAAVANAVADALSPFGAGDLDLPITPEAVWRAAGSR